MIEIRVAPEVESSVHISGLNLRLPGNHSWIILLTHLWTGSGEGADDLQDAFEQGLIEVRISDQEIYPDWYLDVLAENVRAPVELLEVADEDTVVKQLVQLREHSHPVMWAIMRRGLYAQEIEGTERLAVINCLQPMLRESGV